jgi:hypothetical protein
VRGSSPAEVPLNKGCACIGPTGFVGLFLKKFGAKFLVAAASGEVCGVDVTLVRLDIGPCVVLSGCVSKGSF